MNFISFVVFKYVISLGVGFFVVVSGIYIIISENVEIFKFVVFVFDGN